MSGRGKKRLALVAAIAVAVVAVVGAWAFFTGTGSGTAVASTGTLNAPTIDSATAGAGTVTLSWSTVAPPTGSDPVTYYVQRDGGTPGGNCPTLAAPSGVTSCTDSGLSAGTYHYTVTAKWHSWTATGASPVVTVASGAAHHFTVSAATTTPTAGVGDNLTIALKDASGLTVTTYTGLHNLTFGGASAIGSFTPTVTDSNGVAVSFGLSTPINFVGGVATVSGSSNGVMKLYKAETASISVTDGTTAGNPNLSVTVGAAAASQIALTGAVTDLASGGSRTLTATIQDQFTNTVTTGADSGVSVSFSQTGGAGSVSGTGSATAGAGVATKSVTGVAAGSVTVRASATLSGPGSTNSNTLSFNVVAGTATHVAFGVQPSSAAAGATISPAVTVQVLDANNNLVTTDNSTKVTLSIGTNAGGGTLSGGGETTVSGGVATFASVSINKAGTGYTLAAADMTGGGGIHPLTAATSSTFDVTGAAATKLVFTTSPQTITAGGAVSGTITVQRQDANSNPTTVGGDITVNLSSNTTGTGTFRNTADTATITSVTIASGTNSASFKYKDTTAGSWTLTAASSPLTPATQGMTVSAPGTKTANKTGSWNDPTMWTPNGVPAAGDNVLIQGAFTVTIPSGYTAVANSVTYGSSANTTLQTLTFTDATSVLNVGGDFVVSAPSAGATRNVPVNAGTLNIGGSLRLSAGASGNQNNRINSVTITTGTVTVNGSLVYNDGNFASVNALQNQIVMSGGAGTFNLAGSFTINSGGGTATGTLTAGTTSTFNYSGGAAQTIPMGVSSINYNHLKVSNASAAGATLSAAATAGDLTGDLTIAAGSTLNAGNFAHSLAGDFTNDGTFNAGTSTMTFAGSTGQTIGGASSTTFNNLTVNATNTVTLATSGSVAGDLTVSGGTFDTGSKTINRTASGGTLSVSGGTLKVGGTNGFPANYATRSLTGGTLEYSGSSQSVSAESYGGLTFSGSGTKTAAGDLSIAGNFANNGVSFAGGSNTVSFTGTAAQTLGGTSSTTFNNLTVNKTSGTVTLAVNTSVDGNLAVSSGTLDLSTLTANRTAPGGTLTVGAGATLSLGGSTGYPSNYATSVLNATSTVSYAASLAQTIAAVNYGNLTSANFARTLSSTGTIGIAGTFTPGTGAFTVTGSTVDFNGSSAQTIPVRAAATYNNLVVDNTAGATLGAAITATNVTGNLTVSSGTLNDGAFAIAGNAGATLSALAGATLRLTVNGAFPSGFGSTSLAAASTVDYARAGAQTISNTPTYGNLSLSGGNTKTAGGALTANGGLTIAAATTFAALTFSHSFGGDFSNSGTFTAGTSTVILNGASPQTIGGVATTFNNLTISNSSGVSLSGANATVAAQLALGTNVLSTGANTLILSSATAPTGTGYVNGALQRPTATTGTSTFAVGNGTNSTPITVAWAAGTTGNLIVRSTGGEDTAHGSTGINQATDVNSYWTLTASGTVNFAAANSIVFTYPSANVDGAATPATFKVARWNGTAWTTLTPSGTPTNTSTTLSALSQLTAAQGANDFIVGNP